MQVICDSWDEIYFNRIYFKPWCHSRTSLKSSLSYIFLIECLFFRWLHIILALFSFLCIILIFLFFSRNISTFIHKLRINIIWKLPPITHQFLSKDGWRKFDWPPNVLINDICNYISGGRCSFDVCNIDVFRHDIDYF